MDVLAHTTWFTDERPPFDPSFLTEPLSLIYIGIVLAVVIGWRVAATRLPRPELGVLRPLGSLSPWIPRILAVHAGVSLIAQAYDGTYLAPGLDLGDGAVGTALAILEGVIGVWLVSGWRVRPAAMLLVLMGPLGMLEYGVIPILERIDLVGIALFLVLTPPGADEYGATDPPEAILQRSLFALRLFAGTSLVVLSLTEKLINPDLGLALIDRYPLLNVARAVGLGISDLEFIRFAGAVEMLFGLLIISGAMPQAAVIAAGIPFNATLFFFGASELVGHLPVYGVMLAMLVYGSSEHHAGSVPWMPGAAGRAEWAMRRERRRLENAARSRGPRFRRGTERRG